MDNFLSHITSLKKYNSILCLNGDLEAKEFYLKNNLPIIALDGAANKLIEIGVLPTLILGDLDSVKPEYTNKKNTIHLPDQSKSDFEKGIEYLKQANLTPPIITGLSGGSLDHILHNINCFSKTDFLACGNLTVIFNIRNCMELNLKQNTKISLFGMPIAKVKTNGLKWNLSNEILTFPGKNSAFNRVSKEDVKISVYHGNVLCIIYLREVIDQGVSDL